MQRILGATGIQVSSVALGCWPITGLTSLDVNVADSLKTIQAALDSGINFLDTAYSYGIDGESERMIAQITAGKRDQVVIATKGGIHRVGNGQQLDGHPETLLRQCNESLQRLNTDRIELYYLHAPDPRIAVADSAAAIAEMIHAGKVVSAGVSNASLDQIKAFHAVCPLTAIQPPYNMLQREIETDIVPWCLENRVAVCVYWPLLKGLLAGKLARDHQFQPGDGRAKYPMFQGVEYQRNHDLLEELQQIAGEHHVTVAQLVIAWTISQPSITSALCGAKRDWQIRETAAAMHVDMDDQTRAAIDAALNNRGTPQCRAAV